MNRSAVNQCVLFSVGDYRHVCTGSFLHCTKHHISTLDADTIICEGKCTGSFKCVKIDQLDMVTALKIRE